MHKVTDQSRDCGFMPLLVCLTPLSFALLSVLDSRQHLRYEGSRCVGGGDSRWIKEPVFRRLGLLCTTHYLQKVDNPLGATNEHMKLGRNLRRLTQLVPGYSVGNRRYNLIAAILPREVEPPPLPLPSAHRPTERIVAIC